MQEVKHYLQIPRGYDRWLDELRWSANGEAIEYVDGGTFALGPEIALFLEGFATSHRPIHFAHILHLLRLLGYGHAMVAVPERIRQLGAAFAGAGKPLRNAGSLCGVLCRAVPPTAFKVDLETVRYLLSNPMRAVYRVGWPHDVAPFGEPLEDFEVTPLETEVPPLLPMEFQARVLSTLADFTLEELEHWLRHGRLPLKDAGEKVAHEVVAQKPRSLAGVLAALAQRQRLAGAVPFVSQLVSALTLPPRRLSHRELPMGGYADVTMHGQPEQVLPSQFALDDLEFLRRYAENELLYFRREEPHAHTQEELILLMDQGVRTWGDVRLVLSAAVLALGRLALRRKLPFRVAATSSAGQLVDPLEVDDAELGALLEASDLSANPALALERLLEMLANPDNNPSDSARDVVLLTHPRSLAEPDLAAAARRATPPTRLFAVAVNDAGAVQFAELKHGTPVPLSRFQIDLSQAIHDTPPACPEAGSATGWTGDVEPIGFPFRFGIVGTLLENGFDFDQSGEWLLTASSGGILHAWRVDGPQVEILPRGCVAGRVLTQVDAVLGIAGGFVVAGRLHQQLVAAVYDLNRRTVCAHLLGRAEGGGKWGYLPQLRCIVARDQSETRALDVDTGARYPWHQPQPMSIARAKEAWERVRQHQVLPPQLPVCSDGPDKETHGPYLYLDRATGTVTVAGVTPSWQRFTPLADGVPALEDHIALAACCRGNILAATFFRRVEQYKIKLRLFRGPIGIPLAEFSHGHPRWGFALSADGRRLARQIAPRRVEVRDSDGAGFLWLTAEGKCHHDVRAGLGDQWLLLRVGNWAHLLRWDGTTLAIRTNRSRRFSDFLMSELGETLLQRSQADTEPMPPSLLPPASCDRQRFTSVVYGFGRWALVDLFGQVAVCDCKGNVLAMFFVFRDQVAAWLPDGTRFGPASITGGPTTPGALTRIAQVLREASPQNGGDD